MKNLKLEKTDLIVLWTKNCKNTRDVNSFLIQGSEESPYYLLEVNDKVSLYISANNTNKGDNGYSYKIGVIFEKFVEYINFDIDKSEFDSLVNLFIEQKEKSMNEMVKDIIFKGENILKTMINDIE